MIGSIVSNLEVWNALVGEYSLVFIFSFVFLIPIMLIVAFLSIYVIYKKIKSFKSKYEEMQVVHYYIREGSKTFLKRQAKTLIKALLFLFIPVGLSGVAFLDNWILAISLSGIFFILGCFCSILAGYVSMDAATRTNLLVAEASCESQEKGFKYGYLGGMVNGIMNIAMFVLGLWLLFIFTRANVNLLVSFSFGGSISALFTQVGGGIFTKAADIGCDLVGKIEMDIDEDDARNPAVIADAVGDNVGDCAGRGSDLFESALSNTIGGMIIGLAIYAYTGNPIFIISDITLLSSGVFAAIISYFFLDANFEDEPIKAVWRVFFIATGINIGILTLLNFLLFGNNGYILLLCMVMGLLASLISIISTIYYTDIKYRPTRTIAKSSKKGPAINIITGLATGYGAIFYPLLAFIASISISYVLGYIFGQVYFDQLLLEGIIISIPVSRFAFIFAIWGINMASVASDTMISTILSFDTFGPIVDNAGCITGMANFGKKKKLHNYMERLDAIGNTTKAISKGFALVCAGYEGITLYQTFIFDAANLAHTIPSTFSTAMLNNLGDYFQVTNPLVILGLLIGGIIPYIFSSNVMKAVSKGASRIVREIRRQFRVVKGLKEGNTIPDFNRCIDIAEKNALKSMTRPVVIIVLVPLISGILFGPVFVGAVLVGNLIGCLIIGMFMTTAGAAFDNAKKGIESGLFGGKNSPAYKASVIGDTVGDPLKDSAGPSINIELTTINTLAITFLPIFLVTGWGWFLFPF